MRRGDFATAIARRVPLSAAPAEIAAYTARMSDGKVLMVPDLA
jgi:hypothetical protein